ncbi:hypothetical protein OSTOST_06651 [Ostertagia ostertagi]
MFNTSHSTGSLLATPSSAAAAPPSSSTSESQATSTTAPAPFVFGTMSSTNGTKPFNLFESKKEESSTKAPLFGSGLTFGNGPTTSEQVSSSTGILGAQSNADTTGKSLLGSSSGTSLFGAGGTTKPLFPTFGSSADKPFMGTVNSSAESFKPSPFGANLSGEAQKPPLFGASATNSVNKPLFGTNTAATAPTANGGLTFSFGSNRPFQFGATIPEPTFQFGQSTAFSGSTPFQFGSSQPTAPAAPNQVAPAKWWLLGAVCRSGNDAVRILVSC